MVSDLVTADRDASRTEPGVSVDCPFVELSFFTEETSEFFFGRDGERRSIIESLRASHVTVLHAVSGTGKSSLLRAGVAHRLRELALKNFNERRSADFVPVVCSSWAESPVLEVVRQIELSLAAFFGEGDKPVLPERLDLAIRAASQLVDARLLIVLDQFEEYSLYRQGDASKGLLVEQLVYVINKPEIRANFLISIREDAFASLDDLFRGRITDLYSNTLGLDKLNRKRAEEAIRNPIERYNELNGDRLPPVKIEDALVDLVLDQVSVGRIATDSTGLGSINGTQGSDAIEAPYLQLVMTRLWQKERTVWETQGSTETRWLRLSTLLELGGAEEIVRTHLDATLEALSPKERDVAADVFHHLVTPSGAKIAQNVPDLADYAKHSRDEIERVLERLVRSDARVLRRVDPLEGSQGGARRYEIFHDVLASAILGWRQRVENERLKKRIKRTHRWLVAAIVTMIPLVGGGIYLWSLSHQITPAKQLMSIIPIPENVTCVEQGSGAYADSHEIAQEYCNWSKASGPVDDIRYELFPSDRAMNNAFKSYLPENYSAMINNPCGPNQGGFIDQFTNNCIITYGPGKGYGQFWENYLGTGKSKFPAILATSTQSDTIFEVDGAPADTGYTASDLLNYFNSVGAGETNGFLLLSRE
jgi:hypothetical protein